jgi:hypothetical protein
MWLVPTKVFADLLLSLVTLRLMERATRTAGTVRVNRPEASSLLADLLSDPRRLVNCLEADPSKNTARKNACCVCWLPWKSCLSGCCLDTDLHKRCLVIEVFNMWEVSTGGSHKCMWDVSGKARGKETTWRT